jgi:MYXO-CTERM domain-containing protein
MRNSLMRKGVSIAFLALASALSADAAPVVNSFNQILTRPAGDPGNSNYTTLIDLNNDGTNDVSIAHTTMLETGQTLPHSINIISGINGAAILTNGTFPIALHPGQLVDPAGTYSTSVLHLLDTIPLGTNGPNPDFASPDVAVGVRIPAGAQNDYAWLGVQLANPVAGNFLSDRLILHDYGYETTANTAVAAEAPEPASLALIALAAVPLLRRRRR